MEFLSGFWAEYWAFTIALLCFIAFIAGFVDSIAGGGGLFLVPGFLLVGLPPQIALGQEKVVSTLGTIAAIRNFFKGSKIKVAVALTGIPFSMIGAYLGSRLILSVPQESVAKIILYLIPVGIAIFLLPKNKKVKERTLSNVALYALIPAVCLAIGFYDGVFGPGTGSLFILAFHYICKMDLVSSSANSKSFNFASNIGALIAFMMAGKVVYVLALPLAACNIAGNHIGSHMTLNRGDKFVRKMLVLSMLALFASLLFKYVILA